MEESFRVDVAPLISSTKAAQARRRFAATICGGGRILPGMTLKIYIFQAFVWACPVLLSAATLALETHFAYTRLFVGAALNLVFGLSLELFHVLAAQNVRQGARVAWFTDDEELDYSTLFSHEVVQQLLPRSPWRSLVFSSVLGGFTAQLLAPKQLAQRLELDEMSAWTVCVWTFLVAGTAHAGLNLEPAREITGGSSESRALLVVALLSPQFFELPPALAQGLSVALAVLPPLWAVGLVPPVLDLLLWVAEQVELHFFGGSCAQGSWVIVLSIAGSVGLTCAGEVLQPVGMVAASLAMCGVLALPPLEDLRLRSLWRFLGLWLQVLLAAGIAIPICLVEPEAPLRLCLEQAALLAMLVVYVIGCASRRGPRGPRGPRASKALAVEVLEAFARISLLVHMASFGMFSGGLSLVNCALAALQLRQMRLVLAQPCRAAVDGAISGALALIEGTFSEWPVQVQIFVVSVTLQRGLLLFASLRYAAHLCWITLRVPKLRHPLSPLLVWMNVLLWPMVLLVLLLCAVLETPVLCMFTLPLFALSPPRPRIMEAPLCRGAEGLFYSIMAPSLLESLALHWRLRSLSCTPGALLLCRSHARLACVLRVLSCGFGWVQLEMRGLEMQEPTSCHHLEAGLIDDAFAHAFEGGRPPERSFVLEPMCEVTSLTYEQTLVSLRGLLDRPELLRKVHMLFLKSLVWHLVQLDNIPAGWLNCALKPRDKEEVAKLLAEVSWPSSVQEVLLHNLRAAAVPVNIAATAEEAPREGPPLPPTGSPPIIRPAEKVETSPIYTMSSEGEDLDVLMDQVLNLAPRTSARKAAPAKQGEDLDVLMDQVLDLAPRTSVRSAAPAKQAAWRLLSGGRDDEDHAWATASTSQALRASKDIPPARSSNEDGSAVLETSEREESTPLAKVVAETYTAVNVAPLFGQKPESYGTSHVLRLFTGRIAQDGQETPELRWLVERPPLFQLTLSAFRLAVKIAIDAAAMEEEVDMEYEAFADLAQELHKTWFLGVEGSEDWEAAMSSRWPSLMALRGQNLEVQVLRLRLTQDTCRVGLLRPEVWSSIWASSALELQYLANDDDERYSIQAHPTLLRNMAVQWAEYPIFVCPKTTLWL